MKTIFAFLKDKIIKHRRDSVLRKVAELKKLEERQSNNENTFQIKNDSPVVSKKAEDADKALQQESKSETYSPSLRR